MTSVGVPVPPVNPLHRAARAATRWIGYFLILAAVCIVAACIFRSGGWLIVSIFMACTFALGALLSWIIGLAYRKQAKQADEIISGTQTLGRWRCTSEEWARHIQNERAHSKKDFRTVILILGISMLILIGVCIYTAITSKDHIPIGVWLIVVGIFLFLTALFAGVGWLAATLPVRRLKHPDNQEVFIGADGLILGGKFISWKLYLAKLESVRYEPGDPGTIQFRWMQPGAGYYGTPATQEVRAPVPKFADPLARHIVAVFADELKSPPV